MVGAVVRVRIPKTVWGTKMAKMDKGKKSKVKPPMKYRFCAMAQSMFKKNDKGFCSVVDKV